MNEEEINNLIKELFNEDNKEELLVVLKALKRLVPNNRLKSEYLIELLSYFDGAIHGEEVSSKESYEMLNIYGRKAIDLLSLKELEERKENSEKEIDSLVSQKDLLEKEISSMKKILDTYKEEVLELEDNEPVIWAALSTDDVIYSLNCWTIDSYIQSMKTKYMQVLGLTKEECERDFTMNSPFLQPLVDLVHEFNNSKIKSTSSIIAIINNNNWDRESEASVIRLRIILAYLKLPKYNKIALSKEDEFAKTKKLLSKK